MKPRVLLSRPGAELLTFFWQDRPDFYVGYRFFEHDPFTVDTPLPEPLTSPSCALGDMPSLDRPKLKDEDADPLLDNMMASYTESDPEKPVQLSFQAFADGTAWASGLDNEGAQRREFFFQPVDDGVLMWMRLTTTEDIPGPFVVVQCLQFGGDTSVERMRDHSHAAMFSEFDHQAHWRPHESLTRTRRNGQWFRFPVRYTRLHTERGLPFAPQKRAADLDHGLIIRESHGVIRRERIDGEHASGMYWERTAFVGNRHPADCVHSFLDFGPLKAGQSRTVRGKFYLVKGGKDALLEAWRRDFPIDNPDM